METIQLGKLTLNAPYADLLRRLTVAEYADLKADIEERGVIVPIVLDEENNILDGYHRASIAAALGLEYVPTEIRPGLSVEEKRQLAKVLNTHRRHMSPEERAENAALAVKERSEGKSIREIAAALGVPKSTVHRALSNCPTGTVEFPARIVGKDGRERPATMPRPVVVRVDTPQETAKALSLISTVGASVAGTVGLDGLKKALKEQRQKEKRAFAEELRAEPLPLPKGPYRVLVLDPPWKYGNRVEDATHRGRNQYPDMSLEEIAALPVPALAEEDAVLWLWTTNVFIEEALALVRGWGFEKKTILTWDKVNLGLGDYLRNVTEHCILATKGRPLLTLTNQTTLIREKRREHSRKPEAFYSLVESLCPGSKLEMFARTPRGNWASWGAETEKFTGEAA